MRVRATVASSDATARGPAHVERKASMYCPQCGATNDDTATSCGACGYDLGKYRQQWEDADSPGTADRAVDAAAAGGFSGSENTAYQAPSNQAQGGQREPYQQQAYGGPQGYGPQGYAQGQYQGPPYQQQPYPRYYSTPPYQQGPYGPMPYGTRPHIPSYLGWAIAVLILCFWPTGIPAVVFASQVDSRLTMGDFEGARESSRKAKMWCWISFGIAVAGWVLAIIAIVIFAIIGASLQTTIY